MNMTSLSGNDTVPFGCPTQAGERADGWSPPSLLGNFEWALGYKSIIGIVGVDHTTFARTPKPGAAWLATLAAADALDS
jgi:beta-glucosidase